MSQPSPAQPSPKGPQADKKEKKCTTSGRVDPLPLGVTGARARSMSPAEPVSQIPPSPVSLGPFPLLLGVGFQTEGPTFGPTLGNPCLRIDETRPRISESPGSREPFPSYEPANTGKALSRSLAAHPGSAQSAKQGRNGAASARLVSEALSCFLANTAAGSPAEYRLAFPSKTRAKRPSQGASCRARTLALAACKRLGR